MAKDTMKAVVFKGPHKVAIEDRPIPKIQDSKDIIVKVEFTALCGRYISSLLLLCGFRFLLSPSTSRKLQRLVNSIVLLSLLKVV